MANPLVVAITKGAWVKVATSVTTGYIHILRQGVMYQQTYRLTGAPPPVSQAEGARIPEEGVAISSSQLIDVYIWASSKDGSIRVDV
jgi:hypothetical protein